jgi:predicted enzyme related to lactoylglutathione lyase
MSAPVHPIGSFCFAELHTPEPELSARFYCSLLSWNLRKISDDYWMFELNGSDVVGMRRSHNHQWVGYVRVTEVDRVASRGLELGATVVAAPTDTPGLARTSLLADPEGAVVGLWSPRGCEGTAVESGTGSLWWVELATANMAAARSFYASLFEWDLVHTMKFENGPNGYTLFKVGDRSTGGAFQFERDWGLTPMWQVYFEVSDYNAAVAHACRLGGEEGFSRNVPQVARIGIVVDPGDASFLIADLIKGSREESV